MLIVDQNLFELTNVSNWKISSKNWHEVRQTFLGSHWYPSLQMMHVSPVSSFIWDIFWSRADWENVCEIHQDKKRLWYIYIKYMQHLKLTLFTVFRASISFLRFAIAFFLFSMRVSRLACNTLFHIVEINFTNNEKIPFWLIFLHPGGPSVFREHSRREFRFLLLMKSKKKWCVNTNVYYKMILFVKMCVLLGYKSHAWAACKINDLNFV